VNIPQIKVRRVLTSNQSFKNRKRNLAEVYGGVVEADSKRGSIASGLPGGKWSSPSSGSRKVLDAKDAIKLTGIQTGRRPWGDIVLTSYRQSLYRQSSVEVGPVWRYGHPKTAILVRGE
jgi:hypothetical protein